MKSAGTHQWSHASHVSDDRQTMLPGRCICLINNHERCVSLFWCCLLWIYYTVELKLTVWGLFVFPSTWGVSFVKTCEAASRWHVKKRNYTNAPRICSVLLDSGKGQKKISLSLRDWELWGEKKNHTTTLHWKHWLAYMIFADEIVMSLTIYGRKHEQNMFLREDKSLKFIPMITVITNNIYLIYFNPHSCRGVSQMETVPGCIDQRLKPVRQRHPSVQFFYHGLSCSLGHTSLNSPVGWRNKDPSILTLTCTCLCTAGGSWSTCTKTPAPNPQENPYYCENTVVTTSCNH